MQTDYQSVFLSGEDAEAVLNVPVLGFVPFVEPEGLRLIRDISHFSPLMESYRTLRANIRFATEPQPVRSLLVTSAVPAEGKSATVANLAMAMAMRVENNRVIIVDADLRRPTQHKLFKMESAPGLADVLAGTHSIEQVLRPTSVSNVHVICAGNPPHNPAELLESEAMKRLLIQLENACDIVLLDSPPTLAVVDACIVAALTDATISVIGYGETRRNSHEKTLQVLARAKANVIGTVLNRISGVASCYYYGKYYVPSENTPKEATEEANEAVETDEAAESIAGRAKPSRRSAKKKWLS